VPELFGVAAARIAAQCGAQIVFVGAETDVRACAVAQRAMALTSVSLAGRLSLGELAALIAEARVLVCNDGATSQLAAALGTAVVVLHAAGAAQHAPWRVPSRVLHCVGTCPACLDKLRSPGNHVGACGLEPQRLADAALELWRESAGAARAAPLEVEADA
jgi:ADP-heptose:LPS heptosyltransferase